MPTKIEKDALSGQDTTGHEWDGVKELNTPLPTWWVYTFYATIVFAVVYCVLYPSWPWVNSIRSSSRTCLNCSGQAGLVVSHGSIRRRRPRGERNRNVEWPSHVNDSDCI